MSQSILPINHVRMASKVHARFHESVLTLAGNATPQAPGIEDLHTNFKNSKNMVHNSKLNSEMEARDHFKNGASSKSLMSRGNSNWKLLAVLIMMMIVSHTFAQSNYISWGTDLSELFPNGLPSSGGKFTIKIETDSDWWTVSCNETWITISPASGSKNGTVTVTVAPNTTTVQRVGIIRIDSKPGGGGFGVRVSARDALTIEEGTPVGADGTGTLLLNLTVPADVLFTGSFQLLLPDGMALDTTLSRLSTPLASQLSLTIKKNTDGSWLFTITTLNTLRSSNVTAYSKIAEIVYRIDNKVKPGKFEAVISDLSFKFNDGTSIVEDKIPVTITVNSPTVIPPLILETAAYQSNGILYIQSPVAETVHVYSIGGKLLHNFQKPEGKAGYAINQSKGSVLIVKGSSGWIEKISVQ